MGNKKKMLQGVQHEKIGPRSKTGRCFHDKARVLYLQEGIEVFYHDIFSVQAIESDEIALDFANLSWIERKLSNKPYKLPFWVKHLKLLL